jgi:hypothetical protein
MVNRLRELQRNQLTSTEARKKIESSVDFKNELTELSKRFLRRDVSGCNTCYYDAYVKLLLIKEIMPECDFQLRSGALLKDVNKDIRKMVSRHNITNELALYHLKTNPFARKFFTLMPKDVDKMIKKFDIETMTINESSKSQKG